MTKAYFIYDQQFATMHCTNLGDYLHKSVDKMWNIKLWKQTSKCHTHLPWTVHTVYFP